MAVDAERTAPHDDGFRPLAWGDEALPLGVALSEGAGAGPPETEPDWFEGCPLPIEFEEPVFDDEPPAASARWRAGRDAAAPDGRRRARRLRRALCGAAVLVVALGAGALATMHGGSHPTSPASPASPATDAPPKVAHHAAVSAPPAHTAPVHRVRRPRHLRPAVAHRPTTGPPRARTVSAPHTAPARTAAAASRTSVTRSRAQAPSSSAGESAAAFRAQFEPGYFNPGPIPGSVRRQLR